MGNDKKKHDVENLDFTELSGGVEQRKEKGASLMSDTQNENRDGVSKTTTPSAVSDYPDSDTVFLPIPTANGNYVLRTIENVTGKEFLRWAEQIYPLPDSRRPKPEKYDGKENLSKRKRALKTIETYWTDNIKAQLKLRKIQFHDLRH